MREVLNYLSIAATVVDLVVNMLQLGVWVKTLLG